MILIAWAKALIQLSLDRLTGANTHWEQRRGEKGKGGGGVISNRRQFGFQFV